MRSTIGKEWQLMQKWAETAKRIRRIFCRQAKARAEQQARFRHIIAEEMATMVMEAMEVEEMTKQIEELRLQ